MAALVPRSRNPRNQRAEATSTSDVDNQRAFRLREVDIDMLIQEFHTYRLDILLHVKWLKHFWSIFHHQSARISGVATSTAYNYINIVSDFLVSIAMNHVSLPLIYKLPTFLYRLLNICKIIGLLDGFIAHIQRPDNAGDNFYCGSPGKCIDSLNIQYVCNLNGRIMQIVTGVSGRSHDRSAIEWSPSYVNGSMIYLKSIKF